MVIATVHGEESYTSAHNAPPTLEIKNVSDVDAYIDLVLLGSTNVEKAVDLLEDALTASRGDRNAFLGYALDRFERIDLHHSTESGTGTPNASYAYSRLKQFEKKGWARK